MSTDALTKLARLREQRSRVGFVQSFFSVVCIGFETRNGRNLLTLGFGDAYRHSSDRTGTVIDSETS